MKQFVELYGEKERGVVNRNTAHAPLVVTGFRFSCLKFCRVFRSASSRTEAGKREESFQRLNKKCIHISRNDFEDGS